MQDNHEISNILIEYEEKRKKAYFDLKNRESILYKKIPRLEEIKNELNKLAIYKTKSILLQKLNEKIENDVKIKINELKEERKKILNKENIQEDFFIPYFECKKCKDTGYIKYENKKTEMCNCLKQKIINSMHNKSNLNNIQKENFENFNSNIFSNEINIKKYKVNISPKKNIENIKAASIKFIDNFDDINCKNLLFSGNTGLGKTYMTNCIANELLKKEKTVLYQTAPVLLESIIDNKFNKYKTNNVNDFNNQVLTCDLLIIDDLGTECLNNMKLSELFTIINTRILNLNNKVTKTIISTNLSIDKIFSLYEERIGSRIAGFYNIYYFFGEDLRLKKN